MNTFEGKLKKLFNSTLFLQLLVAILIIGIFFLSYRIYFANKIIDTYIQKTDSAHLFIVKNYDLIQIENAFEKIVKSEKQFSQEEFIKEKDVVLELPTFLLQLNNLDVTFNQSINPYLSGYEIESFVTVKPLTEEEQKRMKEIVELWENLFYYNRYITFQGISENERKIANIALGQINRLKKQLFIIQNMDYYRQQDILTIQRKLISVSIQEIVAELNNTFSPYRDKDPYSNSPYLNYYIEEE